MIGYKGPAYNDATKETAALEVLSNLAFSANSDLYQKLVVKEQKADSLFASSPSEVDPGLFEVGARVKKVDDMDYIKDQILSTIKAFQQTPPDAARLDQVRKRLRYQLALSMDNSDAIAANLAQFVALKRTPATINAFYGQLNGLTPADIQAVAKKYLTENNQTTATLISGAAK
jgi:zinc protease